MPKTVARSCAAHDSRSSSPALRAQIPESPNRPYDNRINSTLPCLPHLRDDSVIALARNRSPLATNTPDCSGTGVPPGSASATSAVDATGMRRAAAAVRGATCSTSLGSRGAPTASTAASACQRAPSSSTSSQPLWRAVDSFDGHLRPLGARPADQLVDQHRVAALDGAEHRPGDRRRQCLGAPRRSGCARRGPAPRPASVRPNARRWWPTIRRTRLPAADRPSGPPPARRTGRRRGRRPRGPRRAATRTGGSVRRACARIVASSTSPASDDGCAGMPCRVSLGNGCSRPPQ